MASIKGKTSMPFQPGQSGNPLGRPKKPGGPHSQEMQEFYKAHQDDIRRVGEIVLEKAIKDQEPWAIKLCMSYFGPPPKTFITVAGEEGHKVDLHFVRRLSYEDQQAFLKLWMKIKKGIPAFQATDPVPKKYIDMPSAGEDAQA